MSSKSYCKTFEVGTVYYIHGRKNEIYIGCTTQNLKQRLSHHFSDFKKSKPGLSASEIFFRNGLSRDDPLEKFYDNIEAVVLCKIENVTRPELEELEAIWIHHFKDIVVNSRKNEHRLIDIS